MIYFDNAATTLKKPDAVKTALIGAMEELGNAGRGGHRATISASRTIYEAREALARLINAEDPSRIAFTSNATEALNTAINGLFLPGDHVITTACEHNSVLRPLYALASENISVSIVSADSRGVMRYEEFEKSIRNNTKAIVVTHASNVTGNVTDLAFIASVARKHGLLLIVDAAQSGGILDIDVEKMRIDILCFTGHKGLFGPQGTGGIYVRKGLSLRPLKVGGSGFMSFSKEHPKDMPSSLEAGTLNAHGIAGLKAGVEYVLEISPEKIRQKEGSLSERFIQGIKDLPGVIIYGDQTQRERVGIVSINISGEDSALLSDYLMQEYDIATRSGAHCAPLMHESLGTKDQGTCRFSFSYFNTAEEVDVAIHAIQNFIR